MEVYLAVTVHHETPSWSSGTGAPVKAYRRSGNKDHPAAGVGCSGCWYRSNASVTASVSSQPKHVVGLGGCGSGGSMDKKSSIQSTEEEWGHTGTHQHLHVCLSLPQTMMTFREWQLLLHWSKSHANSLVGNSKLGPYREEDSETCSPRLAKLTKFKLSREGFWSTHNFTFIYAMWYLDFLFITCYFKIRS